LKHYLAIPSISALPMHADDVQRCARWTADEMRRIGLENIQVNTTPGNPIVYGDWLHAPGAPTMLFYGHYDVQPVDPLNLWESPPFEPTVRDGEIYARGAADDKGQVFMHLKAIEAHLKQTGKLPINVKLLIEGEEEVGSNNLDDFIHAARTWWSSRTPRCSIAMCPQFAIRCAGSSTSRSTCEARRATCIQACSEVPSRIRR
jgi:acetylornithine deacetylase/succinyl-diaminopimelate desuccinylase-like protein